LPVVLVVSFVAADRRLDQQRVRLGLRRR